MTKAVKFLARVLVGIVIFDAIFYFVLSGHHTSGPSMFPTLSPNDYVIGLQLYSEPKQGDIVNFDTNYSKRQAYYAELAAEKGIPEVSVFTKIKTYLFDENLKCNSYGKRIIALEGQTVDIRDGKVYVDNILLDEPYIEGSTPSGDMSFPFTVSKGCMFVMGDNRIESYDSRYQGLGEVEVASIIDKEMLRIHPVTDEGIPHLEFELL